MRKIKKLMLIAFVNKPGLLKVVSVKFLLSLLLLLLLLGMQGCADELQTRAILDDKATTTGAMLVGLETETEKSITMEVKVQVAYNFDTIFFNVSWRGNRGDSHDYLHFNNGVWRQEGSHRRDAQSTLDRDASRGRTDTTFTSAESTVSFFLDDPNSENAVPGFEQFGCFLACHDDSQYMPEWDVPAELVQPGSGSTMYLPESSAGRLDLWHLRLGLSNPVQWADDQSVVTKLAGGRVGDRGDAPFELNIEQTGLPKFTLDGSKTHGVYAFPLTDVLDGPYRYFMRPDTENVLGEVPFVTPSMEYILAQDRGYVPRDGDIVPAGRLREPTQSRGDISALDFYFEAGDSEVSSSASDSRKGTIHAHFQRKLKTSPIEKDDTELVDGGIYNIAFAINTGLTGGRDHYVSFPMTLSLNGSPGDIEAVQLDQFKFGSIFVRPDFKDTIKYPQTSFNVFLPGITSYEFLTGLNENKRFFKRGSVTSINQVHKGRSGLSGADSLSCADCHTVGNDEVFEGTAFNAGSMVELVTKRGGVYTPTPIN